MSGHPLNYLITPETRKAHRATWFVYGGPNGERTRPETGRTYTGCGWDVECSCGFKTVTGAATRGSVEDELWAHRHAEQAAAKDPTKEEPMTTGGTTAAITRDDLVKGAVIRVLKDPAGRRPYGLEIVSRDPVSKATGAVSLTGKVLSLDGTTTRRRPLFRGAVVMPEWVQIVKKADG